MASWRQRADWRDVLVEVLEACIADVKHVLSLHRFRYSLRGTANLAAQIAIVYYGGNWLLARGIPEQMDLLYVVILLAVVWALQRQRVI